MSLRIRAAEAGDAGAIAEIHNQGVAERVATFRADPRPLSDVAAAIDIGRLLLVADRGGTIVGWAGVGPYDDASTWYAGVGEATVYVDRGARGQGVGRRLLAALEQAAVAGGHYKLIAKIFTTNEASLGLFEGLGYARVGVHRRHGRLDGDWRDVVVLEKPLGEARAAI